MAFETSDAYKEAISQVSRTSTVSGSLTTKSGKVINIDNSAISSGSFYITNQCVSSDAFAYGSVFAAELGIKLKSSIDRYSLFDAEIVLSYNLLIGPGAYENIPLGKFYVSDPTRSGDTISIKAYDGMIILEEEIEESTTGTPYELLSLTAHKLDIELAQTEEEIASLPNGNIMLLLDKAKVKTYRNLVAYIATITCTFAVFDRYGKLKLCSYGKEVSKNMNNKQNSSSKFSDFTTYFSGVKCKFLESGAYVSYSSNDKGDGLVYGLGEIPIVQGLQETNQEVLDNIFAELKQVNYTPCEVTFSGDPSIDLGDKIHNVDLKGREFDSLVTYYKWTYRGSEQIKSAGLNPKLTKAKSGSNAVDMDAISSEIEKKSVVITPYTNSSPLEFGYAEDEKRMKELIRIVFSTVEKTTALFMATIPVVMDKDGYVEFSIYFDGVYYKDSKVTQYCNKGKSEITFMNYITSQSAKRYDMSVRARAYYDESIERVQAAEIATRKNAVDATIIAFNSLCDKLKTSSEIPMPDLPTISYDIVEEDKSHPTANIGKYEIKAVIFGQGLAGKGTWDGTLTFNESIGVVPFAGKFEFEKDKFDEKFGVKVQEPIRNGLSLDVGPVSFSGDMSLANITDILRFGEGIVYYAFNTSKAYLYEFDEYITTNNGMFSLKTIYNCESEEREIDSGKMCSITLNYEGIDVESVVIDCG